MSRTSGPSLVLRPATLTRWWANALLALLAGAFVLFVIRPGAARALLLVVVFLMVLPGFVSSMRRAVIDGDGIRIGRRRVAWADVVAIDTAKAEVHTRHPRRYTLPGRIEPADLRPFAPDHVKVG
ncbi:MAG: hypothetical protein AAFZ07_13935 [Actinomycetota bacterium]